MLEHNRFRCAKFRYDIKQDGGAVGDIVIEPGKLPNGALVHQGFLEGIRAVTSGGLATVALGINAAGDLLAATAKASLGAGALVVSDQVTFAAAPLKLTARKGLTVTIGTDLLTDGAFDVLVYYTDPTGA